MESIEKSNGVNKPHIATFFSTKGGGGKTTNAVTMAALLGELGYKVLAIDADLQASLTKFMLVDGANAPTGVSQLLQRAANGGALMASDVYASKFTGVDILPSNLNEESQQWMRTQPLSAVLFKSALDGEASKAYDFIIIDSQGSKGEIQRSAALAADSILSPIVPDMLNFGELFAGTIPQIAQLNMLSKYAPSCVPGRLKVFINRHEKTSMAEEVVKSLESLLPTVEGVDLLSARINKSTAFGNAIAAGISINKGDKRIGAKPTRQSIALIEELFPWVDTSSIELVAGDANE
jgi:chromosome partitioning related protein ParA